jgi:penicillin-insensitive murein endopeptidase
MWSRDGRIARLTNAIALALALVVVPGAALGEPGSKHAKKGGKVAPGAKGARSIGPPNHGKLVGAARLRQDKRLRQREGAHSWALPQMVQLLHHAANAVAHKHAGSVMFVGDLSGKTGGHLDRHGSHQSGRDADVAFYVANSKNKPIPIKRFIAFDDAGNARDVPGAHFDEARNWAMVEAFLKDQGASVRYLFVTNGLRARLLAYAAKKHVARDLIERAAATMMSPPDADLHDDHFHVRISCPESMRDVCVEESTGRAEPTSPSAPPGADKPAAAPADGAQPEARAEKAEDPKP